MNNRKTHFFVPTEGPVEIGMSLDIASIDAISEINMVLIMFIICKLSLIIFRLMGFCSVHILIGLHSHYFPKTAMARFPTDIPWK